MDKTRFCSDVPICLGLEYKLHKAEFPYRQDEINPETGELHAKSQSFLRTWNVVPDPENEQKAEDLSQLTPSALRHQEPGAARAGSGRTLRTNYGTASA